MTKTNRFTVLPICLAAGLFTGMLTSTSQSAECFPGPDFQPPAGARWQYQKDSATNRGCWYVEGHDASVRRDSKTRSSRSNVISAESQKAAKVAAPPTERRELVKEWFSSKFSGVTDLTEAYSDTEQDSVRRPALAPERSHGSTTNGKAIAQRKPSREQTESGGLQDRHLISAVALLEAAGDKPVPGLPSLVASDLQKAIEAVGDKDVVAVPTESLEDWQQDLYEEFLRWRLRQVGLKQLER
jgi:hypothetical protein